MRFEKMRTYCLLTYGRPEKLDPRINSRIPPCKPVAAARTTCEHGATLAEPGSQKFSLAEPLRFAQPGSSCCGGGFRFR